VAVRKGADKPFSSYILEILDVEGYLGYDVADLAGAELCPQQLVGYDGLLLADIDLSASELATVRSFAESGGWVVALRPPPELADLFGLSLSDGINKRMPGGRLVMNFEHPIQGGQSVSELQVKGVSDLYDAAGAEPLAWLAVESSRPLRYPAVCVNRGQTGRTAAFTYDLAACVVSMHQGRPENASTGSNADSDGDGRWIPNDLFVGEIDPALKLVPQADLHQDLLVRVLNWITEQSRPLPRVWHFPDAVPCVAFFNGDSDGMSRQDYDTILEAVERRGGRYTCYLMTMHHELFSREEVDALRLRGHGFGQHVILDWDATVADAERQVSEDMAAFEARFGFRPSTNRGHCLIWPGWAEMAEILAANGVSMDQNFIPRRFLRRGYLNGSALPVRFTALDGSIVDLYEQNTQLTDDGEGLDEKFLLPGDSRDEVVRIALQMLEDCRLRWHGVFQPAFHPEYTKRATMWLLEPLLDRCRDDGVPMVGGDQWVAFNRGRRGVRAVKIGKHDPSTLAFTLMSEYEVHGATIMVPYQYAGADLKQVRIEGDEVPVERREIKGATYGLIVTTLTAGCRIDLEAVYVGTTSGAKRV